MLRLMWLLAAMLLSFVPRPVRAPNDDAGGGDGGDGDGGDDGGDDDADDGDAGDDDADDEASVSEIRRVAKELGITPAQLAGRLKASRKWESRAKATHKELEDLRKQHMTDNEKALEDAKAAGRDEERKTLGARLVAAEVKVAAAGRMKSDALDTLVDSLNPTKFLTDDGEVDTEAVKTFVEGVVPAKGDDEEDGSGKDKRRRPDMGQGRRSGKAKASVSSGRELYEQRHPKTKE